MKDQISHLLELTSKIADKYNAVDQATGQRFNVFSILGLEYAEVRTHSAFLAELLNPKGSHFQGDLFLSLFVKHFKIANFDTKNASVEIEKHIGFIDGNYETGGQIDLFISDNTCPYQNIIIIENKIWAGDQYKQLQRYSEFGNRKTVKDKISLFYLTPFGTAPSNESKVDLTENKDFKLLSYQSDIIPWLEECFKAAASIENLRVSINQYIYIIKKMNGQALNTKMTAELKELFLNKDYFDGFFELEVAMKHFKVEAQKNFWVMLIDHLKSHDIKFQYSYNDADNNEEYLWGRIANYYLGSRDFYNYGLYLSLRKLNENTELFFKIGMWYSLYFGIQAVNNDNEIIKRSEFNAAFIEIENKLFTVLTNNKKWVPDQYFILSASPENNFNFSNFKSDVYYDFYNKTSEQFNSLLVELDKDIAAAKKVINETVLK